MLRIQKRRGTFSVRTAKDPATAGRFRIRMPGAKRRVSGNAGARNELLHEDRLSRHRVGGVQTGPSGWQVETDRIKPEILAAKRACREMRDELSADRLPGTDGLQSESRLRLPLWNQMGKYLLRH